VQDEGVLVDRDSSGKVMKQSTTEERTPRHGDLAAFFSRKGKQIATESQLKAYVQDQVNTGQHNSVVQIHSAIMSDPTVSLVKSYTVDECSKEQQDQQQLTKHAERQNPPKNDDLSKAKAQGEPSDELAVREGRQDNFVAYFDSPGHSKPRDSSSARNVALYKFNTRNPQIELAAAIEEDNLPMVQALIDRGISINPDLSPFTPLMKAVHVGNLDMVTLLTQQGADVSPPGPYTWTPLTIALAGGHNEIANHLLDLGANVAPLNESNAMSPFDIAACRGDLDMMHRLASLGADINRPDSAQISPLMGAARHGHLEAVKMLINWRADLLAKDKMNRSALQFAAANGHVEIVNLINDEAAKSVFGRVNISNIIPNIEESSYHEVSFPSVLKNYARVIGSYSLGSEKNHRLFAINKRADKLNSWGGEDCVILQKWALGSNKGEIIAAGQDHLDAGNVLAPLTSIFQVGRIVGRPWRPVSHEVKFLRADLSETQEPAVLFRFKISDSFASNLLEVALAHSSNEQAAVLSQFRYLEWREVTEPPSKPNVLEAQSFTLSLQNDFNPTSVDDRATGSESKDSATVQGKCLATLELTGPWDKSESFVLRIEDHLSPFGYAMVTITALMIWNRYNDKRTSRKYMREVLGHIHKGKKSWFVIPKELDQS
jgi:ankyrin repeat protein